MLDPLPTRRLALAGLGASLAAACTPLGLFATLTPRDGGVIAWRGEAYGDDPRQRLDVYARRGTEGAPVCVFFYGGSWNSGRRQDYGWVGQALAARGFVAVVADYRLHPQVQFPGFLQDGALAVRWLTQNAQRFGGDPGRIALSGHSAGGYNAVMLGLDPSYLNSVGVKPEVVRAVAGLAGPYDFLPLDDPTTIKVFGKAPDLPRTQPGTFARAGSTPAFLATGLRDNVVWPRNTQRLAARLREAGAVVEERGYEGLDHAAILLALSRPLRGRAPVLDEMAGFLMKHAGSQAD